MIFSDSMDPIFNSKKNTLKNLAYASKASSNTSKILMRFAEFGVGSIAHSPPRLRAYQQITRIKRCYCHSGEYVLASIA